METSKSEKLKELVREKYGAIAEDSSCCGSSCCGMEESKFDYSTFSEDYTALKGYNADADLKLGCGVPTEFAQIREGDTVVDLGSGAGNDAFVARAIVGEQGHVIGVHMTPPMIAKARANTEKLGFTNVEFRLGEIEQLPIESNSIDVVISNCVLNLVPDKEKAFAETYRILKPGGHFSVSDVVLSSELPEKLQSVAELYAGCVSGAILKSEYLEIIERTGFHSVAVQSAKAIEIPADVLAQYLSAAELKEFEKRAPVIWSITVFAKK